MRHETLRIQALSGPVSITVDNWGIAHIRAGDLFDMFVAQGFNAACDRLWQMDLWRKRGLGLLAADFGPGYWEQDRAARLCLYRGDMDREWACYSADAERICEAFVAGVNAFIALCESEPDRSPPEFATFGTKPARWAAADVVRMRSHALMRNALSEVTRAHVMAKAGADVDLLRQNLDPARIPEPVEGLDLASVPMEALDIFRLALAPVTFERDRLAAPLDQAAAWRKVQPSGEVLREASAQGSNNWVVAGHRTRTGRPILANDPHRTHATPSLRYLVHLSCPEFDGVGAGEPVAPGIMSGHNGAIAFGLTIFCGPDQEDVYVYETSPADPDLYRYGDGWERMREVVETAAVKGAPDQTHVLKFTRHGPVVFVDAARRRAYAVRSVWFEPGSAPYLACLSSMRARTYDEFATSMKRWSVPAVNQVYADVGGDIAWIAAGASPIRHNWDGLLPIPGDGRFEWKGFHRAGDLPFRLNPKAGYVATANEMNVPADWSLSAGEIGYEWIEGSRAARIEEVLSSQPQHSVEAACALQTDLLSLPARRLLRLLDAAGGDRAAVSHALRVLAGWDAVLSADSAAAALFEVWWSKHLRPALFAAGTADKSVHALLAPGDAETALGRLEAPEGWFAAPALAHRDALLLDSLAKAYDECAARMGGDVATWAWGRLHHGFFEHPLSSLTATPTRNVGPLPMGGGDSTPMNATYRPTDFRVVLGATFRIVIDVGGWDNSLCINAPGQSGDPRSPHYSDLADRWSRGEYVPLLYSREAIAAAAEYELRLQPESA